MASFDDVLAANAGYARQFDSGDVPGTAARGLAVITCMDSRIRVPEMLGLREGDAYVLRNAGARVTDEVLRTLVLAAHLLAVTRVLVLAHTDCRMTKATDEELHAAILERGVDTRSLDFQPIADQVATLARDVQRIRSCPYLPDGLVAVGGMYDVTTGRIDPTEA